MVCDGAQLVAELADGFEERQAFDVADGAADLDQGEIDIPAVEDSRDPARWPPSSASVMWGMTWTVPPLIVAAALAWR